MSQPVETYWCKMCDGGFASVTGECPRCHRVFASQPARPIMNRTAVPLPDMPPEEIRRIIGLLLAGTGSVRDLLQAGAVLSDRLERIELHQADAPERAETANLAIGVMSTFGALLCRQIASNADAAGASPRRPPPA